MSIKHTIRANGSGMTKEVHLTPIRAIRYLCIECMNFQTTEVEKCTSPLCPLYPYRRGKNTALSGKRKNNIKLTHQQAVLSQNTGDRQKGKGVVAIHKRQPKFS
jgi:hypothetical protein